MHDISLLWVDLRVSEKNPHSLKRLRTKFAVRPCRDSTDVASRLRRETPDAILLEFDYPDAAGLEMARELKQRYPSMPMILLTLQHSEELAVWTFRSGFTDYLVKPLTATVLEDCRSMLERINAARINQQNREMAMPSASAAEAVTPAPRAVGIDPAIRYVADNYTHKISSSDVASLCSMSPYSFSRKFKEKVGISFRAYVLQYRLRQAKKLLQKPHTTVSQVAYSVGFNDLSYFSRMYRDHFGCCPSSSLSRHVDEKAASSWQETRRHAYAARPEQET